MVHSVLESITRADIRYYPFPHIVVENCLPADYYRKLSQEYPSDETILDLSGARSGQVRQNSRNDLSAHQALKHASSLSPAWQEFVRHHVSSDLFRQLVSLLGPEIKATHPAIESQLGHPLEECTTGVRFDPDLDTGEISLDCQIGINTPTTQKSSVRRVHTDATEELFAMLLYFRREDDFSKGGELEIFRWKRGTQRLFVGEAVDEADAVLVSKVPYAANTLVIFINSDTSLHAVSEREPTPISRRLVNIIGRTYRSIPEGLFDKHQKSAIGKLRYKFPQLLNGRL